MEKATFNNTLSYKLVYIFEISDKAHKNCLKIGETTIKGYEKSELSPNCEALQTQAHKRILQYTTTAAISYNLLWTELAVTDKNEVFGFSEHKSADAMVREVLYASGHKKKEFGVGANEWVADCNLQTAKNAITAVKEGREILQGNQISKKYASIIFYPEQKKVINETINRFKTGKRMLWNIKMRFGKTLCALEVIKEVGFKRTIVITHRPVVGSSWQKNYLAIFSTITDDYLFIPKGVKEIPTDPDQKYIYFASIQDLRGSNAVNENSSLDKNDQIFKADWDLIIVDEAHEGTQTELGLNVFSLLKKENTKILALSGTPFNLLEGHDYLPSEILTWDYTMEQEAKEKWQLEHFGDTNPYGDMPKMNIFVYDISEVFNNNEYVTMEDKEFNFAEFFRVWTGDIHKDKKIMKNDNDIGKFIHEDDVKKFIELLRDDRKNTNYPFSNKEYRRYFKHSLWKVPGVKEAKALEALLNKDAAFSYFKIANVAGDGDSENRYGDALELAEKTIRENEYTITLSCGKLTTGVTVPEWTAVLYLAGSYSTSASAYLQTIFRVQTPASIDGQVKDQCFVFDFAPDRTLTMLAEASNLSVKAGALNNKTDKEQCESFLKFCPVIAIEKSNMIPYNVNNMMETLKKAYAERVFRTGFEHEKLYNDILNNLDDYDTYILQALEGITSTGGKGIKNWEEINMAVSGLVGRDGNEGEEHAIDAESTEKTKKPKTERSKWVKILRAVSVRIPLLIYGADISLNEELTLKNFTNYIDDCSWAEFMPKNLSKNIFGYLTKFYDEDIFNKAAKRIHSIIHACDAQHLIEDRTSQLTQLFATFKNPDKETVLTPWRVVNMHLGNTLGGWNFYNDDYSKICEHPRQIVHEGVTRELFEKNSDLHMLDINSKTGLYPLYLAYSKFRFEKEKVDKEALDTDLNSISRIWKKVLSENIFVITKTKMAMSITKRTLAGFTDANVNILVYQDIVKDIETKNKLDVARYLCQRKTWSLKGSEEMKFDVVVGNPPYQHETIGNVMTTKVYHNFYELSLSLDPTWVSLIFPAGWEGTENGSFNELTKFKKDIKSNHHIQKFFDYVNSMDVFPSVDIKGGVCYFLHNKNHDGKLEYTLSDKNGSSKQVRYLVENTNDTTVIRQNELLQILKKIDFSLGNFSSIVSSWDPFGFISDYFEKNNEKIDFFPIKQNEDDYKIHGLYKSKRAENYIANKDLKKNIDLAKKWKVLIPRANGSGALGEIFSTPILGTPILGTPMTICTDTFLTVGCYDTEFEAIAVLKYIKTKFLRVMIGILKFKPFNYRDTWAYVPIQNFTTTSDIDWKKSVSEIDKQLYQKYNLSDEEIHFIESRVRVMQ
ncbi:MAG: Eco57I restriction-modification methylase domain-containing protein [Christensenellaceae bacterium]|jgi:hypothetical protein|nr:Eco57I restriction-modification methylase domain-containing protein [Christensenellaceae bacterium]